MHTHKKILLVMSSALLFSCSQTQSPKLADFGKNIYSQFGEDGIIEKIFEIIGTESKIAIEFGAADGFSCSNTANLWTKKDLGWFGILIEADHELYKKVVHNVAPYNCAVIHRAVGITQHDSLESILTQENLTCEVIDLLSIDIDGNDYYVLQSLQKLRPRVIICEYNVSIPAHLDVYPNVNNHIGCSVAALQRVAAEKGYTLIAITDTNCIFIQNEDLSKFECFDIDRDHIKIDRYVSYIINDYKSGYKIIGPKNFIDAWGWSGKKSDQQLHGSCSTIYANIIRS